MAEIFLGQPYDREDLAVTSSADVSLSVSKYKTTERQARAASITFETAPVRYCLDGTAVNNASSPPVGDQFTNGNDTLILRGFHAISKFKVRAVSAAAVMHVTYYI